MRDVELSFAYFSSVGRQETVLFAHMKQLPVRGEATTDFLGFYGFYSGQRFGPAPPDWLKPYTLHETETHLNPDLDLDDSPDIMETIRAAKMRTFVNAVTHLQKVYKIYAQDGQFLDYNEIYKYLNYCRVITNLPISNAKLEQVASQFKREDATYVPTMFCIRVSPQGNIYFAIGGPHLETRHGALQKEYTTMNSPHFDWDRTSQVGDGSHLAGILEGLNRRLYKDKPAYQKQVSQFAESVYSVYACFV